jgi:GLPGLI family protein
MRIVIFISLLFTLQQISIAQTGLLRCRLIFGIPDTLHRTVEPHELVFNATESMDSPGFITKFNAADTMRIVKTSEEFRRRLVYKNRKTNQMLSRENAFPERVILTDTLRPISWKLLPGTRKIGGYVCNSAYTKVFGRKYTVWYAPEIPISDGIWKFYGLPGLILEAIDDERKCMFLFESLNIPVQTNQLTGQSPFDASQRRLNHNEYVILLHTNLDNWNKLHLSPGITGSVSLNTVDVFEIR